MHSLDANEDSRCSFWLRVRQFAVPPSMIESATARRLVGDWAGACTVARIDVDLDLRSVARTDGRALSARIRADLRHLAPDLLRWHMPRIAPNGLLRPGLTMSLARYDSAGRDGGSTVHLVARTPPAWADAGQRISLALWDGSRPGAGPARHPHPRPDRRFRLDLHRHLWDARKAGELRTRAGKGAAPAAAPQGLGCAVDRWAAEAGILLRAEGQSSGAVTVRLGTRRQLVLDVAESTSERFTLSIKAAPAGNCTSVRPVLPDAATWVLPDLELLRAGLLDADQLHPLVAAALVPGRSPADPVRAPESAGSPRLVECRGAQHRIGLVDGALVALDHAPAEVRREELLTALGGTPLPCLQAIDEAHRRPECLTDVRARLDHGDAAGALAIVEGLLGPDVLLRNGALRDELEMAARRQVAHGLFRAGLAGSGPGPAHRDSHRDSRRRPRPTSSR